MATDVQDLLQRSLGDVHPRAGLAQRVIARHQRSRRRRRLAAGYGAAVLAAAAGVLTWATLDTSPDNAGIEVQGTPSGRPPSPKGYTGPGPIPTPAVTIIPQGQRTAAPALDGTTIDGKTLNDPLSRRSPTGNAAGYISVVNFCGSWSASCRSEQKVFAPLEPNPGAALSAQLIGVDERDSLASIRTYVQRFGLTYPVIFDDGTLAQAWGTTGVPVTFVIDPEGRIAARLNGAVSRGELLQVIKVLLFEQPQSTSSKSPPPVKPETSKSG